MTHPSSHSLSDSNLRPEFTVPAPAERYQRGPGFAARAEQCFFIASLALVSVMGGGLIMQLLG